MEQENNSNIAILQMSGNNQRHIVPEVSKWLVDNQIEIVHFNQHVKEDKLYARMELNLDHADSELESIKQNFTDLAEKFQLDWDIIRQDETKRLAVFVSRMDQHLIELITRIHNHEIPASIELIISNHRDVEETANQANIPFHYIPITSETKQEAEQKAMSLIDDEDIDLIVLARYMQILTPEFVSRYQNKIINIHHSLLPAFKGAKPYERAYERGEKIIGATAHYVKSELDAGPIIYQEARPVDHSFSVQDLKVLGSHIEKTVLAHAVALHVNDRIMLNDNRTVIL